MPVRKLCWLLLAYTLSFFQTRAQVVKPDQFKFDTISPGKPLLKFNGGYVNYDYSFRSRLDSPFAENNLSQHVSTGYLNFIVANKFPVRVTYLARHGNSAYFRDIFDVRADFDVASYKQRIISGIKGEVSKNIEKFRDSLSEKLYISKIAELKNLKLWFESPSTVQTLYEMNEVVRMPAITYDRTLPDSVAKQRSDSLQRMAALFLDEYTKRKQQYDQLILSVDSLKKRVEFARQQVNSLKEFVSGNYKGWRSLQKWKSELAQFSDDKIQFPRKYEWLLGIRNFNLGRTQIDHSELTAKNLGLNGISFEYNSWYYFAVTAGLIDYRFRDFSFGSFKKTPQYLYMVRLGLGELENNYFIISAFKGQKQLYTTASLSKGAKSVGVSGLSVEGKWRFARNSYFIAEAAQSFAPDLISDPPASNSFWNLSDHSNKAISFKLYSFVPRSSSRIEALYKYTGPRYQGFNSFQTNAAFTAWYLKLDQSFFRRSLKLTAAVKSNEFSNPYIIQNYKSTSVFKTVMLTYRKRKMPVISVGYIPASQFIKLDNRLLESRFQTLNVSVNHVYRLGTSQTASTIVFNRFYNTAADSSFAYFNATNVVIGQSFFFKSFNAALNLIQTKNPGYQLNVLDGNLQVPVNRAASFAVGAKINTLNKEDLKVGYYGNVQLRLWKDNLIFCSFEKSYLNGPKNTLSPNDFINIGISKYFR